jgi:hypothetical protein
VVVLPVLDGVHVRIPSGHVYIMCPPSLAPSLEAKGGGGRDHHTGRGREAREVDAGLVHLGGERSRQAVIPLGNG